MEITAILGIILVVISIMFLTFLVVRFKKQKPKKQMDKKNLWFCRVSIFTYLCFVITFHIELIFGDIPRLKYLDDFFMIAMFVTVSIWFREANKKEKGSTLEAPIRFHNTDSPWATPEYIEFEKRLNKVSATTSLWATSDKKEKGSTFEAPSIKKNK